MENDAILEGLKSAKSTVRRKAATAIGKDRISSLASPLLHAYLREAQDPRTWETQSAMIRALGRIRSLDSLPCLKEIVQRNLPDDALTMVAATSLVRLLQKSPEDIEPIIELFRSGSNSVREGAIAVLAFDRIIPKLANMNQLIELVNSNPISIDTGNIDPREYLISAMAAWPEEIVSPVLAQFESLSELNPDVLSSTRKRKHYHSEY
jgi:HEAT repeat protein